MVVEFRAVQNPGNGGRSVQSEGFGGGWVEYGTIDFVLNYTGWNWRGVLLETDDSHMAGAVGWNSDCRMLFEDCY